MKIKKRRHRNFSEIREDVRHMIENERNGELARMKGRVREVRAYLALEMLRGTARRRGIVLNYVPSGRLSHADLLEDTDIVITKKVIGMPPERIMVSIVGPFERDKRLPIPNVRLLCIKTDSPDRRIVKDLTRILKI